MSNVRKMTNEGLANLLTRAMDSAKFPNPYDGNTVRSWRSDGKAWINELARRIGIMEEYCEVASTVGFDGVGDNVPYAIQQRFGKAEAAYRAMKGERDASHD